MENLGNTGNNALEAARATLYADLFRVVQLREMLGYDFGEQAAYAVTPEIISGLESGLFARAIAGLRGEPGAGNDVYGRDRNARVVNAGYDLATIGAYRLGLVLRQSQCVAVPEPMPLEYSRIFVARSLDMNVGLNVAENEETVEPDDDELVAAMADALESDGRTLETILDGIAKDIYAAFIGDVSLRDELDNRAYLRAFLQATAYFYALFGHGEPSG